MKLRIEITDDDGRTLELAAAEAEHGSRQIYDYLLKAVYSRDGFMLTDQEEPRAKKALQQEPFQPSQGTGGKHDEN